MTSISLHQPAIKALGRRVIRARGMGDFSFWPQTRPTLIQRLRNRADQESWRVFDEQPEAYRAALLPEGTPKISVEAGATLGWWKYVGHNGAVIGIDRFGASAPGKIALEKLGISVAHVVETAKGLVKK